MLPIVLAWFVVALTLDEQKLLEDDDVEDVFVAADLVDPEDVDPPVDTCFELIDEADSSWLYNGGLGGGVGLDFTVAKTGLPGGLCGCAWIVAVG